MLRTIAPRLVTLTILAASLLAAWLVLSRSYPPAIVPSPGAVWSRFVLSWQDGTYLPALGTTVEESVSGWFLGGIVALPLGYVIGRVRALEEALAPYLAASQAMPIVAIAPVLALWLGNGLPPKLTVAALITFFPILATTASGARAVPRDLRDAARVFGAGWFALAVYVDLPLAARTIFAGLKVSAALSVTGAVVGELVGSSEGLGFLINLGSTNFDTALMFVALVSLMILGATMYAVVGAAERVVLRWDE